MAKPKFQRVPVSDTRLARFTEMVSDLLNSLVRRDYISFDGVAQWSFTTAYILAFGRVAVAGQSDIVADAYGDTLTVAAGAGVALTTNAATDTLTIASTITQYTDEMAQDAAASLIQNGTGISWVYNDAANTLTPTVTLAPFSTTNLAEGSNLYFTAERVDDEVALLIQNGTGITWSYNDPAGTLTPTVSLSAFTTTNLAEGTNLYYTDERVDDRVAALLQTGDGLSWTYNDAANTLTPNMGNITPDAVAIQLTNLSFATTAQRVTGDFSNATRANRVYVQTSTLNSFTVWGVIPNGTSTVSGFSFHNAADPDNSAFGQFTIDTSAVNVRSTTAGTGSAVPLELQQGTTACLRVKTDNNIEYPVAGQRITADTSNATHANRVLWQSSTVNGNSFVGVLPNGTSTTAGFVAYGNSTPTNAAILQLLHNGTDAILRSIGLGAGVAGAIQFQITSTAYLTITANTLTLADATNIVLNTTTGTKIGTATGQKLGFFNATPVVQPATTGTTTGFTAGTGTTVHDDSTFTGGTGSTAYRVSDIIKALKNLGLLAG